MAPPVNKRPGGEYVNWAFPTGNLGGEGGVASQPETPAASQGSNPWGPPAAPYAPPVTAPAPAAPAAPAGNPMPGDWSLQQPGAAETLEEALRGIFTNPMWGEEFARGILPGMVEPGAGQNFWEQFGSQLTGNMGAGNVALQEYQNFARNRPDIATDPGLGPYYENAKRRALESVGQQSAAAGGYGSSVAQDVGAEAVTNLEAERANREADYNLRRLAEDRMYGTSAMMGAGNAAQNQLGWATGLGNLAMGAEEADLARQLGAVNTARGLGQDETSRLIAAMNSAIAAQAAREGRIGGAFDDIFGFGRTAGDTAGGVYNEIFDQEMSFEDIIQQLLTGKQTAGVRESESDRGEIAAGFRDFMQLLQASGVFGPSTAAPPVTNPQAPNFWSQPWD